MGKHDRRKHFDRALFVVLVMAGAAVSAVLDVRAIAGAMAPGTPEGQPTRTAPERGHAPAAAASAAERSPDFQLGALAAWR